MKKVIVACGTGIATSTVVCVKIKEALAKANVEKHIRKTQSLVRNYYDEKDEATEE